MAGKITPAPLTRTVAAIAADIRADYASKGKPVHPHAAPYVDAMARINTADVTGPYGTSNDVESVLLYGLSNLSTWRGPVAQRVKAEIRGALATIKH